MAFGRQGGPVQPGNWRPRLQSLDWGLIALGGLALFAASPLGHIVAIISMLSIIGIPLYFALAVLPSIFLIYVFVRLVRHGWRAWRAGSFFFAAVFAVLAIVMADFFVFGAWRENARLDARVGQLRAEDRDRLGTPGKADTLAIVTNSRNGRDAENVCGELCQRLLLNGEARRVLVRVSTPAPQAQGQRRLVGSRRVATMTEWPPLVLDEKATGKLYWLQAGAPCGDMKIAEGSGEFTIPAKEKSKGISYVRDTSAAEAMRLRIANGECLMSQDASITQADAAILYGTLTSGKGDFAAANEAHADTINAWRVAYFGKINGQFTEAYRHTSVRYLRFPYVRAVSYVHGYQFAMTTGYVRLAAADGAARFESRAPVEAFVMDRLGLKLHLDQQAGPAGSGDALARILSSSGAISELDAKVVQDYIGYVNTNGSWRDFKLSAEDVARILRIASDRRLTLSWQFGGAVASIGRDAPERAEELSKTLFARLAEFSDAPPADGQRGGWTEGLRSLSSSMARLPDDILRMHRAQIEALSRTSGKRDAARSLINRMDIFGPEIVPALLAMYDSAALEIVEGKGRRSSEEGAEAYAAALRNLCRLGERASFALPMLWERATMSDTPMLRRHRDVVITTFARMGASEDDVRALMKVDMAEEKAVRNFDNAWRRALRQKPCE